MNYKQIHDSIIERAKNSNRSKKDGNYYEAHHIVPRCMDGEGTVNQWRTHPNIVLLTAKEHIIIHRLLCEIYTDNHKLVNAYWMLANGAYKKHHKGVKYHNISSREYERLKTKIGLIKSENYSGKGNPNFGNGDKIKGEKNPCFGRTGEKNPNFGRTGEKHPMFGKKGAMFGRTGDKHPAFGRTGEKNPMFGKKNLKLSDRNRSNSGDKNHKSRKVICNVTGKIYDTIKEASDDIGVNRGTLNDYLIGRYTNKTSLRFYE